MLAQGRDGLSKTAYERHQPEQTLLYQLVEAHYPALVDLLAHQGNSLPDHVNQEFESYLKCGSLEHGFLRVRCDKCHFERLVAFSCKKRGFCPSCGARRMAETAALLADEVFSDVPLRQWVISFHFPLRYLFAAHPQAMGKVLGIVYPAISTHLIQKAGFSLKDGATGAVTLIQRFGSALNLNIHFHVLFLDGVYVYRDNRSPRFQRVKAPDKGELEELVQLLSQRVGRCLERQGLLEQDTESVWLPWYPNPASTSPVTTASWRRTTAVVGWLRQPGAGKASSLSLTQKSAQPPCHHDLGPAPKTCVQYRHRGLWPLRWFCQGHRQH